MPNFEIHNLWPIPIYKASFEIQQQWLDFAKKINYIRTGMKNGSLSVDKYILNSLPDLKNEILLHCENYTKKYLKVKDNANFYLQNSWILKHQQNDWAQAHFHGGSLISGVYYLDVFENSGEICFVKTSSHNNLFQSVINLDFVEANYINTDQQDFNVKAGDLLLFPSQIMHKVRPNLSNVDRYSLAFNFFVKGKFGAEEYQLEIN